ncbi:FAD/NAD(P)-binding protein [Streptomyces sp. AM 2-1-1]|uniref:FAD/NAD(P)-binding protein n=1 Tax=Streptomyces sp. AM 2-1-1 TaxID=3028709 RepID=UPI0023B8E72B|nr:FAD/NAD(P)-binding protein [Streptomyces sp. AM 2-1-1]WEH39226.1 FAD/NAD(P)-binding protein [Streptomyces sp. AM 2-1-1]
MSGNPSDTRPLSLVIVGSGPRGISVLERLAVRAAAEAATEGPAPRPVRVHLVDATEIGAGRVWRTDQDDWFTMNTVISQVTMYSGGPDEGPDRAGAGPSLGQWIARRHEQAGETLLGPDDYASRVRYGQYLNHVYRTVAEGLPPHVELVPVTGRVTAVRPGPDGGYLLSLETAPHLLEADRVVLATGHPFNAPDAFEQSMLAFTRRTPGTHYLCGDSAADMALGEDTVPAGSAVGVKGLGLSFYDVMLSLTVGRGGVFRTDRHGELCYLPSGREPRIVAGSRSGLPIPARGRNQKRPDYSHKAQFLTRGALESARASRSLRSGSGQLDFAEDVLPLLQQEIDHVYRTTQVRVVDGPDAADRFAREYAEILRSGGDRAELLSAAGLGEMPPIDLDALARPFGAQHFASVDEFREQLLKVMEEDLAQAALGTVDGPLKAALDVLRDIRNVVREAVDHGGLLPASHTEFFHGRFLPVNALLSAGPPMERVEQLRALIRQGVVEVAGPGTRFETDDAQGAFRVVSPQVRGSERLVHTLIDARIPTPDLHRDTSPLTRQLVAEGRVRPYTIEGPDGSFHVTGGLDVTTSPFHVIDADGRSLPDVYALGIPTEHTRWFTQVGSSRPGVGTLFYRDADAIASDALRPLRAEAPAAEPVVVPGRQPKDTAVEAVAGARRSDAS